MCGARRFLARAEAFLFSLLIIESMHLYLEILHGCTAEQNPPRHAKVLEAKAREAWVVL